MNHCQTSSYTLYLQEQHLLALVFGVQLKECIVEAQPILLVSYSFLEFGQLSLGYESLAQATTRPLSRQQLLRKILSYNYRFFILILQTYQMSYNQRSRQKNFRHQQNSPHRKEGFGAKQKQQSRERPRFKYGERVNAISKFSTTPKQDRTEVCPFLVKIYYMINGVNNYKLPEDLPKDRVLVLHLWMSSSITQITELIRAHIPSVRPKQRYLFSRVFEQNNRLVKQQIGTVMVHKKAMPSTEKKDWKLGETRFSIGDYIDVSINYV